MEGYKVLKILYFDYWTGGIHNFTAIDKENENVAYYVIEVSISGNTRYCQVESASIKNCN